MHHRFHLTGLHDPVEEDAIADIADDQLRLRRHGPVEPGGQIVEHDDPLAALDQLPHHLAADIAGAPGDQYAHTLTPHLRSLDGPLTRDSKELVRMSN